MPFIMTLARKDILGGDGDGVWVHCISRCVRRAFLCGVDRGRSLDHRKVWVEQRLRLLAEHAAVEVAGYAVMSNHLHAVLRMRADWAAEWSAREVARRWLTVFPRVKGKDGEGLPPTESHIAEAAKDPRVSVWRGRLADLGWCLRALKEPISRRANAEDGCSGAFWEGRYQSVPLLDQAALVACMAYVDLNPIRAQLADRPERSRHTGVRTRIVARQAFRAQGRLRSAGDGQKAAQVASAGGLRTQPRHAEDGLWLAPVGQCVAGPPGEPMATPLALDDYLTLVDATGRLLRDGKRGRIPPGLLPILARLDIQLDAWLATMQGWREFLGRVVGGAAARVAAAARAGQRWLQNRCALFGPASSSAVA
jgi:hypothetical protein